jgi:hypothetical protein
METTLKQQVLTKITALPDNASFEEVLNTLRTLRPPKNSCRPLRATADTAEELSCFDLMQPVSWKRRRPA